MRWIRSITLGDTVLEGGDEAGLLKMVSREVAAIDPDIIITEHGDSFDLPYLYHRAALHEVNIQLGREKDIMPGSSGRSYFSYGRISTNRVDASCQGGCTLMNHPLCSGKADCQG